jgi:phosphoserine phosphatase
MAKRQPKKEAVIYDLDHTLTKKKVANNARKDAAKGKKVLVLTSRPSDQRKSTKDFLMSNGIPVDKLVMRPKGDARKDSKSKKDQYEKKIKGKYKVEKAYDDKPSNVKMLRSEGVKAKRV